MLVSRYSERNWGTRSCSAAHCRYLREQKSRTFQMHLNTFRFGSSLSDFFRVQMFRTSEMAKKLFEIALRFITTSSSL